MMSAKFMNKHINCTFLHFNKRSSTGRVRLQVAAGLLQYYIRQHVTSTCHTLGQQTAMWVILQRVCLVPYSICFTYNPWGILTQQQVSLKILSFKCRNSDKASQVLSHCELSKQAYLSQERCHHTLRTDVQGHESLNGDHPNLSQNFMGSHGHCS